MHRSKLGPVLETARAVAGSALGVQETARAVAVAQTAALVQNIALESPDAHGPGAAAGPAMLGGIWPEDP